MESRLYEVSQSNTLPEWIYTTCSVWIYEYLVCLYGIIFVNICKGQMTCCICELSRYIVRSLGPWKLWQTLICYCFIFIFQNPWHLDGHGHDRFNGFCPVHTGQVITSERWIGRTVENKKTQIGSLSSAKTVWKRRSGGNYNIVYLQYMSLKQSVLKFLSKVIT